MAVAQTQGNEPGLVEHFHVTQVIEEQNGSRPWLGIDEGLAVSLLEQELLPRRQDRPPAQRRVRFEVLLILLILLLLRRQQRNDPVHDGLDVGRGTGDMDVFRQHANMVPQVRLRLRGRRHDKDKFFLENGGRMVCVVVQQTRGRNGLSLAAFPYKNAENGWFGNSFFQRDFMYIKGMRGHFAELDAHW